LGLFWGIVVTEAAKISIEDAALVERYKAGDSTAMERLILRYQQRIYNAVYRMCANPDDAAELTQDTFVKVIENIDGFGGRSSFYTWLFRIAMNLTINHCKRKARIDFGSFDAEQFRPGGEGVSALKEILCDGRAVGPGEAAENTELCRLVLRELGRMDEMHRAVLVLRDIEGMDYAQIAAVLDVEVGTVKSRLSRARNTLRRMLESHI